MSKYSGKYSLGRAVLAILSGFIGIRKRESADADSQAIRPLALVITGVLLLLTFISILLFVVKLVL